MFVSTPLTAFSQFPITLLIVSSTAWMMQGKQNCPCAGAGAITSTARQPIKEIATTRRRLCALSNIRPANNAVKINISTLLDSDRIAHLHLARDLLGKLRQSSQSLRELPRQFLI